MSVLFDGSAAEAQPRFFAVFNSFEIFVLVYGGFRRLPTSMFTYLPFATVGKQPNNHHFPVPLELQSIFILNSLN